MTIDCQCQACEGDFEIDSAELLESSGELECPHCGSKANPDLVEDFIGSLDEVMTNLGKLRRRFSFSINLETDDIPTANSDEEDDEYEDDDDDDIAMGGDDVWGDDDDDD